MFIVSSIFIGITHDLWLVGVFHASFNIESFPGERMYVVSLNISICFEDEKPCYLSVQILHNTRLPRRLCTWETKYYIERKDYLFLSIFLTLLKSNFCQCLSWNFKIHSMWSSTTTCYCLLNLDNLRNLWSYLAKSLNKVQDISMYFLYTLRST